MKILGIDPGTKRTGWGIIEIKEEEMIHLEHGVIITLPIMSMGERLFFICSKIIEICKKYEPEIACIEETFCGLNGLTSLRLGYIFGALLCTFASMRIRTVKYPTKSVKRIVAEKGSSSKDEVEIAVMRLLKLNAIDNQDSSDALAVAIAHVFEEQNPIKKITIVKKKRKKRLLVECKIKGDMKKRSYHRNITQIV